MRAQQKLFLFSSNIIILITSIFVTLLPASAVNTSSHTKQATEVINIRDRDSIEALNKEAESLILTKRQYEEGLKISDQVIKADPKNATAFLNKAGALEGFKKIIKKP